MKISFIYLTLSGSDKFDDKKNHNILTLIWVGFLGVRF